MEAAGHGFHFPEDAGELRQALRSCGTNALLAYLEQAETACPGLAGRGGPPPATEKELEVVLSSKFCDRRVIGRILNNSAWTRIYKVKKLIANHRETPQPDAMRLLPHLYWRDLHLVGLNLRVSPIIRRSAESRLNERLPDLSLGEKTALAREASRGVIAALMAGGEEKVFEALLVNPRLTEEDILAHVESRADGVALGKIGVHPKWSFRYPVRLALARHSQTPRGVALGMLSSLKSDDLRAVVAHPTSPPLIKSCAQRVLEERSGSRSR